MAASNALKEMFHIQTPVKRDRVLGVDFGSSSLKIVQVTKRGAIPVLDTYAEVPLGPYLNTPSGSIAPMQRAPYTRALIEAARAAGVTAEVAALVLPNSATFTTILTVNALEDVDITAAIPVLVKDVMPVQLRDVSIDWFPVAQDPVNKKTIILVVAVYNNTLATLKSVMQEAGFTVLKSELEYFSAQRSVASAHERKTHVIIDMGAGAGKSYHIHQGMIAGVNRIGAFSGERITGALAAGSNTSFEQAETTKCSGTSELTAIPGVRSMLDRGVEDFVRYEKDLVYHDAFVHAPITLIGGGAEMRGLGEYLKGALGREVVPSAAFHEVAYPALLKDIIPHADPLFAVALSAALGVVTDAT